MGIIPPAELARGRETARVIDNTPILLELLGRPNVFVAFSWHAVSPNGNAQTGNDYRYHTTIEGAQAEWQQIAEKSESEYIKSFQLVISAQLCTGKPDARASFEQTGITIWGDVESLATVGLETLAALQRQLATD